MTPITRDRLSGSTNLIPVLNLGHQAMTGIFPKPGESVPTGPLELLWCPDSGLLQLGHSYDRELLFGDSYGYRSGLNAMMVKHLTEKAAYLTQFCKPGDVVLDIGSNDGTLLNAMPPNRDRVGMDPTIAKFHQHYGPGVTMIPTFFSACAYLHHIPKPAKVVSMVACFYDLDDPIQFCRDVRSIMRPDGVFHIEVADARVMIEKGLYDGICHEHAVYYTPRTLARVLHAAGFRVDGMEVNSINGGSFNMTASLSDYSEPEGVMGRSDFTLSDLRAFERRVGRHVEELFGLLRDLDRLGKSVVGYGASTKFNVVLQALDQRISGGGSLLHDYIPCIADANPDKWGRVTPGTNIPIISEAEMRAMRPDYLLVGPYHFRAGIAERERALHDAGTRFIWPFPEIEVS